MPWLRSKAPTEVNFYFERQSGSPISYTASPDLNGDGFAGNDPIYVPKNATDPNEIKIGSMTPAGVFTQDAAAAADFEKFISGQACLNAQRGQIMANSCFSPWQNRFDMSIRQSLPKVFKVRRAARHHQRGECPRKVLDHISEPKLGSFNGDAQRVPQQQISRHTPAGSIARSPGPLNQSCRCTFNSTLHP
jgi:hypothetical protein